jgi:cyclopropane fatty-acyl-phospholipid synthase-like methyltransferase
MVDNNSFILEIGYNSNSMIIDNALQYQNLNFDILVCNYDHIKYLINQIKKYNIENIRIKKLNFNNFISDRNFKKNFYSRVISIECLTYTTKYKQLFEKINYVLKDDGFFIFKLSQQ